MTAKGEAPTELSHHHVFLAPGHEANERRTWAVIWLCGAMMVAEIIGGAVFGSIALIADGLHMSTHAGALLLAALAYTFSRKHAEDRRFSFGTGKVGDLAGFSSAVVLAMIALLIGYEAITRFLHPVAIHFGEAIPIAVLGLGVNVASAWLLSAGGHHHHHHGHSLGRHPDEHGHGHEDAKSIVTAHGTVLLSVFEDGVPPRFRLAQPDGDPLSATGTLVETIRPDGAKQSFEFADRGRYLESLDEIPEPHAFTARLVIDGEDHAVPFTEQEHGAHDRDNNMRAAVVHVLADAAVSVLVIVGLLAARVFGWLWMDPLAGIVGAFVIASWSYGLIRDTGAILLDMNPDRRLTDQITQVVSASGDEVADLHLWRLGPGHLGAILSVWTTANRDQAYYQTRLAEFPALSHVTVEVMRRRAA